MSVRQHTDGAPGFNGLGLREAPGNSEHRYYHGKPALVAAPA